MTTKSPANTAHDAARAEDARRAHAELHAYITSLERGLADVTRERDEAREERVHDVLAEPHAYIGGRERTVLTCAVAAASAPAVEAYTRRVQAEALESAAGEIEARGEATRHPWMLGPSKHNPSGTVLTDAGAARCDEARWLRARAAEIRGGR